MKLVSIVGVRPQFIKIDRELKQEVWHAGCHYDYKMSEIFFKELELPKPKYNLNCRTNEVGKMVDKFSRLMKKEKPTLIIVYGDANCSLAGALAAAHQFIPIVHIEAGLRSFQRNMPEEINRILIDKLAKVKICPTKYAQSNLLSEGIKDDVYVIGDPMFDTLCRFVPIKRTRNWRQYILLTLHRNFNADNRNALKSILEAIEESQEKIIFPIHPRTAKNIQDFKLKIPKNVKVVQPKTYKQMLSLISNAKKVITDSGGVQKEAFWMNVPVIILRTETEWLDIPAKGGGILVGDNKSEILRAIKEFKGKINSPPEGMVNKRIRETIYRYV